MLGRQKLASLGDYVVPLCYLFKRGSRPWFQPQFLDESWHENEEEKVGKFLKKDKKKEEEK